MATLSSPGIGTGGLDVKSIITQLVALEQRPLNMLKLQAATTTTKISAFGQIQSLVSTLHDAVGKLNVGSGWNGVTATTSDKDFVSVTAQPNTKATTFDVTVSALAKAQRTTSLALNTTEAVGAGAAGTLNIQLGKWDSAGPGNTGAFSQVPASSAGIDIVVKSTDTIADIAGNINGANAGVIATIFTDGTTQRLVLTSKETGEESGFKVTALDAGGTDISNTGTGLGRLATAQIDPNSDTIQRAADAQAMVGGLPATSPNNSFTNISGVTFKAEKVTTGPITISVAPDTSATEANIAAFVKAYNEVNKILNDGTKYDAATKSTGLLQGDSTALGLQSALRSVMQSASAGSQVFQRLADIGVVQRTAGDPMATVALGGELEVSSKLKEMLAKNPDEVKKFFMGDGSTTNNGFANRMRQVTTGLLAGDGFFKSKESVLKSSLKRNEKDQEITNMKINNFEKRLTARYTALDVQMSSLNALNAYISQQVTTWNKSNG